MIAKDIKEIINLEKKRQNNTIELIASENYVSKEVRKLMGSVLTNKYAEGYPGNRYYGGCQEVDKIEDIAINKLLSIFNAKGYHANVQPHSGSQANMAIYKAMLDIGDTVLSMDLNSGGHLTHGSAASFSGKEYNIISYGLNDSETIDYADMAEKAKKYRPKMIIVGASAYTRKIDFAKCKEIADSVKAYLMCDIAHIAGLIVAGLHPSPVGYADFITSTTHKTLRGPRGGIILYKEEYKASIDKAIFPGIQGGPLMHVIAAKAQCFYEASTPEFKSYQRQVLKNVKAMEKIFTSNGVRLVSGGSDNHMLLVNVKDSFGVTGKEAEKILEDIGVACNKNMIAFDTTKPSVTSGIRIGAPAMTTKGFKENEFEEVAKIIINALAGMQRKEDLKARVQKLLHKSLFNL
jgi:glycine hydroxymethyltransferase